MDKSAFDLIMERKSVRLFLDSKLGKEKEDGIVNIAMSIKPPFGSSFDFRAIAGSASQGRVGTYGLIKNPAFYLGGIASKADYNPVDYGYIGEMTLLRALDQGISSCWLGGVFSKGDLAKALPIEEGQVIPAIIAMGEATGRRHLVEKANRLMVRADTRKSPDELFKTMLGNPLPLDGKSDLSLIIDSILVAPSASNKQPWRMLFDKGIFHLYLRRDESYSRMIKRQGLEDLQRIDIGIAMAHLELVTDMLKLKPQWKVEDPNSNAAESDWEYIISCKTLL